MEWVFGIALHFLFGQIIDTVSNQVLLVAPHKDSLLKKNLTEEETFRNRKLTSNHFKVEVACGFLAFSCDFEFSRACSFCSDFDLDVLEVFISGTNYLVFFEGSELSACSHYCSSYGFDVVKCFMCMVSSY
jgi:hypothetical protein